MAARIVCLAVTLASTVSFFWSPLCSSDELEMLTFVFAELDLPEYETYEQLRHQMYTAMTQGSEYFGFA
jgi:hypothetical protein